MSGGKLHEALVAKVLQMNPGAATSKFWKSLWAGLHDERCDYTPEHAGYEHLSDFLEECGGVAVLPDAFRIDVDKREVIVWEVAVAHRVLNSIRKWYDTAWALDEFYWDIHLVVVDERGVCSWEDEPLTISSVRVRMEEYHPESEPIQPPHVICFPVTEPMPDLARDLP